MGRAQPPFEQVVGSFWRIVCEVLRDLRVTERQFWHCSIIIAPGAAQVPSSLSVKQAQYKLRVYSFTAKCSNHIPLRLHFWTPTCGGPLALVRRLQRLRLACRAPVCVHVCVNVCLSLS